MAPAGIEPATFRFVAQYLNHWATAVPPVYYKHNNNNGCSAVCVYYVLLWHPVISPKN